MKALLGKLILYAVLVNFILFIAGLFIDFGQVLTDAFLRAGASSDSIATALSPQKLLLDPLSVDTARNIGTPLIAGAWFSATFTWLLALIMILVGFMLLLRFLYLSFLLVIMPI